MFFLAARCNLQPVCELFEHALETLHAARQRYKDGAVTIRGPSRARQVHMLTLQPLKTPGWMPQPRIGSDKPALFIAERLDDWTLPESLEYSGLVLRRPFAGKWDAFQKDIDEARQRFGTSQSLVACASNKSARQFALCVDQLLATAALPRKLSGQIREDACSMGRMWQSLYPAARELEVKLEIFGENTCSRWHQDHFVGRAIVSYTGSVGTEYTRNSNVNFWELQNCGNNDHIIRDAKQIESVAVGDFLLIKGTKYPQLPAALVHKSPEKLYDEQGRILNRLVLKVDVISPAATRVEELNNEDKSGAPAPIRFAQGIMRNLG